MIEYIKTFKMNLNEGLYSHVYILRKLKKVDVLKNLSKKQLEKLLQTLDKELQFQNSYSSGFLAFMGLILVIVFYTMPILSSETGGGNFLGIDDRYYKLESIDVKMIGEEYDYYPDGVTGTYSTYKENEDFGQKLVSLRIGMIFYVLIGLHYLNSLLYSRKIYKVYNTARYIHSLK